LRWEDGNYPGYQRETTHYFRGQEFEYSSYGSKAAGQKGAPGASVFPGLAGRDARDRVLTPGGRVSLNVRGDMSRQAFFSAFAEACGVFMGDEAERSFDLPFSLNTSEGLHALAECAGLKEARVRFEHRTIRFPNVAQFAIGFVQASPVAAKFIALPDEQKEAFGAHIAGKLKGYVDDGGMAVPQENHFLLAYR
jgi:hypothetical protein